VVPCLKQFYAELSPQTFQAYFGVALNL